MMTQHELIRLEKREIIQKWCAVAINRATAIPTGTVFMLKDLFDKMEWKELAGKVRALGRVFRKNYDPSKGKYSTVYSDSNIRYTAK